MSGRNRGAILVLAALASLASQPTAAEDHPRDNSIIVHNGSGFHFPVSVAGFARNSLQLFNDAGTNIDVSYTSLTAGSPVAVTVYVMPAPTIELRGSYAASEAAQAKACDDSFAAMDKRIASAHPGARQLVSGSVKSPSKLFAGTGRQVIYDYEDMFYGQKQTLRSETDLYCYINGDWLVAFRSTSPIAVDYAPKLAAFMQALEWPAPGTGKALPVSK